MANQAASGYGVKTGFQAVRYTELANPILLADFVGDREWRCEGADALPCECFQQGAVIKLANYLWR
jgi:hypothetical protein